MVSKYSVSSTFGSLVLVGTPFTLHSNPLVVLTGTTTPMHLGLSKPLATSCMGALPGTGSCADLPNPLSWETGHLFEGGTWWTGILDFSSTNAEFAVLTSQGAVTAVSGAMVQLIVCQCLEDGESWLLYAFISTCMEHNIKPTDMSQ